MKQLHGHLALRTSARLLLSSITAITFSASLYAEETLDNITVTANRMPSVNVLAPTTIITRDDIERLQISDLPTLLSRQPGIDMVMRGGLGKTSDISMRGTKSDHVLVLVDGIKWHSATSGGASLQDFPIEQIERIEIVRGSRSGLYGSEAIGGVIQIFTRQGKQGVTPYAKLGYGTHDSKKLAAGVSGGNSTTHYSVNVNHESTEGINAKENVNPDKDGYRNNSFSAKISHNLTNKISIGANFVRVEGHNEADPSRSMTEFNTSDAVHQILGINSKIAISDLWSLSLQLNESRDQTETFRDNSLRSEINTRHRAVNVINTFTLTPEHTLNVGLDYDIDDIDGSEDYLQKSRDNKAAYVSWQANVAKHGWLISARHDDNEAFGHQNTGNAEYGYWLQDDLRLSINTGIGFKAPTFNDLYWPASSSSAGNPDLLPEESKSIGASINGDSPWGSWAINVYQNEIENLIDWKKVSSSPSFWTPSNIANVKIKGIEFEFATVIGGWDTAINASFLKPENEETGNTLERRAQRLANVNIDKQWSAWSTGATWKLRGHSFDDEDNTDRLGGYGLLDIRIAYDLSQDWSINANLTNVFNKEYQTVETYNSLDRMVMFTLSYQP